MILQAPLQTRQAKVHETHVSRQMMEALEERRIVGAGVVRVRFLLEQEAHHLAEPVAARRGKRRVLIVLPDLHFVRTCAYEFIDRAHKWRPCARAHW